MSIKQNLKLPPKYSEKKTQQQNIKPLPGTGFKCIDIKLLIIQ
jgi:hypothetical protein